MHKTADNLASWSITSAHGSHCAQCRDSIRNAEDYIESTAKRGPLDRFDIFNGGHNARATNRGR